MLKFTNSAVQAYSRQVLVLTALQCVWQKTLALNARLP